MPTVASGPLHAVLPMVEASQVGDARRQAQRLATAHGLDEVAAGRLAIIVTELGNNLVRHAQGGRLLLAAGRDDVLNGVEVLSLDDGPGMDLADCLRDGFSTGGTSGTGLGAVRRQADVFDAWSEPGAGTVLLARVDRDPRQAAAARAEGAFECGAAAIAAPGEIVCGDGWLLRQEGDQATLVLADGLGHGPGAQEAALGALAVMAAHPFQSPAQLMERMHAALRPTRGAAVTLVRLDAAAGRVDYAGAGNVVARLVSGTEDRSLLVQHGTAGVAMSRVQQMSAPWPEHALLVLHSDGLATRWRLPPTLLARTPSLVSAALLRDHARGRDDATVVVVRRRPGRARSAPPASSPSDPA